MADLFGSTLSQNQLWGDFQQQARSLQSGLARNSSTFAGTPEGPGTAPYAGPSPDPNVQVETPVATGYWESPEARQVLESDVTAGVIEDMEAAGFSEDRYTRPFETAYNQMRSDMGSALKLELSDAESKISAAEQGSGDARPWARTSALGEARASVFGAYLKGIFQLNDQYSARTGQAVKDYWSARAGMESQMILARVQEEGVKANFISNARNSAIQEMTSRLNYSSAQAATQARYMIAMEQIEAGNYQARLNSYTQMKLQNDMNQFNLQMFRLSATLGMATASQAFSMDQALQGSSSIGTGSSRSLVSQPSAPMGSGFQFDEFTPRAGNTNLSFGEYSDVIPPSAGFGYNDFTGEGMDLGLDSLGSEMDFTNRPFNPSLSL